MNPWCPSLLFSDSVCSFFFFYACVALDFILFYNCYGCSAMYCSWLVINHIHVIFCFLSSSSSAGFFFVVVLIFFFLTISFQLRVQFLLAKINQSRPQHFQLQRQELYLLDWLSDLCLWTPGNVFDMQANRVVLVAEFKAHVYDCQGLAHIFCLSSWRKSVYLVVVCTTGRSSELLLEQICFYLVIGFSLCWAETSINSQCLSVVIR